MDSYRDQDEFYEDRRFEALAEEAQWRAELEQEHGAEDREWQTDYEQRVRENR